MSKPKKIDLDPYDHREEMKPQKIYMKYKKLYQVYIEMKQRCKNENNPAYKNYGGRGIKICDRWLESFENFLLDMGECPKGKSLDRIDNNKGYSKENCKFSTREEQNNNRRMCKHIVYDNIEMNWKEAWLKYSKELGITYRAFHKRMQKGYPIDIALFAKPRSGYNFLGGKK